MKQPLKGGSPTLIASVRAGVDPSTNIVTDGDRVYWISQTSLLSVPRDGGPVTSLASKKANTNLLIDGNSLYWVRHATKGEGTSNPQLADVVMGIVVR
jgi:hypothetical protein